MDTIEADKLALIERVMAGELAMHSYPLGEYVTNPPNVGNMPIVGWAIVNGEMTMFYRIR